MAVPTLEQQRLDRSLRLWGASGQDALDKGHVCLIGASAAGTEMLKNLILPGLGNFSIVDTGAVTERDVGSNFFVSHDTVGASRGATIVKYLSELNPPRTTAGGGKAGCTGTAVDVGCEAFVTEKAEAFFAANGVTLVACSPNSIGLGALNVLGEITAKLKIPLIVLQAIGTIGFLRVQAPEMCVVYTEPTAAERVVDLRVTKPFPELEAYFAKWDPRQEGLEIETHSHIPWPVIVYHALKLWRSEENTTAELPTAFAQWKRVKELCKTFVRRREPPQNNFLLDAPSMCNVNITPANRRNCALQKVLADPRAAQPSATDEVFWFLVHGLKTFVDKHGLMPCNAAVPDMTATSAMYTELQKIFADKAKADAAEIKSTAVNAMHKAGLTGQDIDDTTACDFCKNAWHLNAVSFPPIASDLARFKQMGATTTEPSLSERWFVAYHASRHFFNAHGYEPGNADPDAADLSEEVRQSEVGKLKEYVAALFGDNAFGGYDFRPYLSEMSRFGGAEIINVATVVGAIACQEAIKLLMKKRVPASHTVIYDSTDHSTGVITK